jgi:hypothetical protein
MGVQMTKEGVCWGVVGRNDYWYGMTGCHQQEGV